QGGCMSLVLAGKPLSEEERGRIRVKHVVELNHPTKHTLEWLYSNAQGLLITSRHEGFCLPILEGQACGCPVFIPDREPMTEVAGAGAFRYDPENPADAAVSIGRSLPTAQTLRSAAEANVLAYRQGRMAAAYASLYGELAGNGL